ncbi:ZIP family metal transporter [Candidatus Woesearchaeota archaeon]|nr:ZIP family metal transporter [Candidatus Woesearchaeota archaeon]
MGVWLNSMVSVIVVSLISLVGVLALLIKRNQLNKILLWLVSFSAGALFGGAFIHLIPEVVEEYGCQLCVSLFLLLGILVFFVLEKFIQWRHCHIPTSKTHPHPLAFMNLIGDGFHNLIDGMIIGGAYLANFHLGLTTTIAVILHEIPQEIGDFGVLLHAKMSKFKALTFNFLSALTAILGAVISILIGTRLENYLLFLLPLTAGGFIYIAGSDLIPELHKECAPSKSFIQLIWFVLGIAVMLSLKLLHLH